ncbi:dTDP-4-dehydrorhamnose 3,5-epimerase [Candidatus Magnetomoraceae bacterium gMMP-15]
MKFIETKLKGAFIIEIDPFLDHRGMFARIFCKKELKAVGLDKNIVQINHSSSRQKGTIRGLHYQKPPKAEIKIVKCIKGAVYDVLVDIRKNSPTFLKWYGIEISRKNMKLIYIPEGFAHGFQVIEENSELLYFHTEFYCPEYEGAINYNDPMVCINWPLEITEVSERDRNHLFLTDTFQGVKVEV